MKAVRKVLYREVWLSILLVALAFLGLFLFFDLLDELPSVGKEKAGQTYTVVQALIYVLLYAPMRLYELMPIAVLIGTILALARLAQSSEFTILRVSGMSPWLSLRGLLGVGLACVVMTFVVGDYVAPKGIQLAQTMHGNLTSNKALGSTGAWLREQQNDAQGGQHQFIVNVRGLPAARRVENVLIIETDAAGQLVSKTHAAYAEIQGEGQELGLGDVLRQTAGTDSEANAEVSAETDVAQSMADADALWTWELHEVVRTTLSATPIAETNTKIHSMQVNREQLDTWQWQTGLTPSKVATAMQRPDRMSAISLFRYAQHLESNGQDAQVYEIGFWRKVFYPLSCLVMVVLALPFAYLHFRSGTISTYVFVGVLVGISFFLLNNVFGHIGNLNHWRPWLAAAAPSMVYSVLAMGVFVWLVRNR